MNRIATRFFLPTLTLAALLLPLCAMAQAAAKPTKKNTTVVVVDRAKVVQESKVYKQIQDEYKAWEDGFKAQFQPKVDLLRSKQKELGVGPESENEDPESKPKIPDAQKTKLEKEIQQLTDEINKLQVEGRKQYEQKQQEGSQRVQAMLKQVIEKLAAENGWDVVLNKGEINVVWFGEALDHTDTVMARLDTASASAKAPVSPPAAKPAPKP